MKLILKLLCAALLVSATPPAQAFLFDRCNTYECSCEPLYCGAWGLQFDVGIRPIIWTGRDSISLVNCFTSPIISAVSIPKFSNLFHLPWQIGGQLSYALSTHTNVFTEVNYAQAKGKKSTTLTALGLAFAQPSKYKLVEWYVGAHYYWDRMLWCGAIAPFIGGKVGLIHHKNIRASIVNNALLNFPDAIGCANASNVFARNTVFAGGGLVGLDYCYCGNWSFVLTAEVVVSCAPCSVNILQTPTIDIGVTNPAIVGGIRNEIAFPITLGAKYNF